MQAYPFQHKDPTTGLTNISVGMTLRDYFAAEAMVIVMSPVLEEIRKNHISDDDVTSLKRASAEACYAMADAMMEARK
jgi:hypothetical protein